MAAPARRLRRVVLLASSLVLLAGVAISAPSAEALTLGTTQLFEVGGIAHDGSINGVHCVPEVGGIPAGCVSVGTNEGTQHPLVVVGSGATQTASYADADGGRHMLSDVWCATSERCIAVGWADATTGNHQYIMEYSGGTWTRVAAVDPADQSSVSGGIRLNMISCTDIDNCAAVGWFQAGSAATPANYVTPIAYSKIAGTWSVQVVQPAGMVLDTYTNPPTSRLSSVECVSATTCYAVGTHGIGSGTAVVPFVATGTVSGGSMSWTTADVPFSDFSSFSYGNVPSISCSSSVYCVVAGNYTDTSAVSKNFFWEMSSGAWDATASTFDINPTDRLWISSIDCPVDDLCYLPTYTNSYTSGAVITFAAGVPTFDLLVKSGATSGWLDTIDCPSAYNCVVGGSYQDPGLQFNIVLGSLEGGVWSIDPTYPALANQWDSYFNTVTSLSCTAHGVCLAGSSNRANNAWRATLTDFSITMDAPPTTTTSTTTTTIGSTTTTLDGGEQSEEPSPESSTTLAGDQVVPEFTG